MFASVFDVNPSGRSETLRSASEQFAQARSVVVSGARGMGRTHTLGVLAKAITGKQRWLVQGRDSVPNVPLVPFAGLLSDLGVDNSAPLTIYTSLPRVVADLNGVLLVDDADQLDQASTVLVTQLCRAGITVAMTTSAVSSLGHSLRDPAITAKWMHVRLEALSDFEIAGVAEGALGSVLAAPTAMALAMRARGNPGLAYELVKAAQASGTVETTPAGGYVHEFHISAAAGEIAGIDASLSNDESRSAAEVVALAGQVPTALFTPAVCNELVTRGLARIVGGTTLELVDALAGDAVLSGAAPQQWRSSAKKASSALSRLDEHAHLTRTLLALAGQAADPHDVVAAARNLHDRGLVSHGLDIISDVSSDDLRPPERFALFTVRSALQAGLGQTAAALGDLDQAAAIAATDEELVQVAELWMMLLGGRHHEDEALELRISEVLERLSAQDHKNRVSSALARRRAILGQRNESARSAATTHPGTDEVLAALRDSLAGTRESALATDPGDAELSAAIGEKDLDGLLTTLAQFLMLTYNGDLGRARQIADTHYDRDAKHAGAGLGLWTYNRSKIAFHAGQYGIALPLAEEAVRHLAWRDITGQALPADAMLAATLARTGQLDRAEAIAASFGTTDASLPRVAIGIARVRAERLRIEGSPAGAAAELTSAGESAMVQGELFSGAIAIDEACMIEPHQSTVDLLLALTGRSALVDAYATRAVAVLERDPAALQRSAATLESLVQPGRAAHAWRVAAKLWTQQRRSLEARKAEQQAVRVASTWQTSPWPDPHHHVAPLTVRELEVAQLAARRSRNREIALTLGLSQRTVENHLARAFRKLGITRRDELADALDLPDAARVRGVLGSGT